MSIPGQDGSLAIRCFVVCIALLPLAWAAQASEPKPTQGELDAISKRGALVFRLDTAAARSTDALRDRGLALSPEGLYICYEDGAAVMCAYGAFAANDDFALDHLVNATGEEPEIIGSRPSPDRRRWLTTAASAVRSAADVFPFDPKAEAYNYTVVPEKNTAISVYFYPATRRPDVRVLGADGVVTVESDGTTRLQRFHQALLEFGISGEGDAVAGAHTHTGVSIPNPLDVRYVLQPPSTTEYVLGKVWAFEVDRSGAIRCLGNTEEFIDSLREPSEESEGGD